MEGIKQSFANLLKALDTLEIALNYESKTDPSDYTLEDQLRDSRIQRFEYSAEALWKFAKKYLAKKHAIYLNTPKSVMAALFDAKVSNEKETEDLLFMIDMRNKTSHMYFEELARQLDGDIQFYFDLMRKVTIKMADELGIYR